MILLETKLSAPHLYDTIQRRRLHSLLEDILIAKVFTVTAGAGYGKTTLIAQGCKKIDADVVWYRLDDSDTDFVVFIQYLIAGIQKYYKTFGTQIRHHLMSGKPICNEEKKITRLLLQEMEKYINVPMVIVIDDYHLINAHPHIAAVMSDLLEFLPRQVHFVIISRTDPAFNIPDMIAKRQISGITEKDLAFNQAEIQKLYECVFGILLDRDSLKSLFQRTDGWPAGLIMFHHVLKDKDACGILRHLKKYPNIGELFVGYLSQNVMANLPESIRFFLMKTSILKYLEIDYCDRFLSINNSKQILKELETNHLFTFPDDEIRTTYYYHHLFRSFLYEQLKNTLNEKEISALYASSAQLFLLQGKTEEALVQYIHAKEFDRSCELLGKIGRELIMSGRTQSFLSYYSKIPVTTLEGNPWVQYTMGRAMELSGRTIDAVTAFDRAQRVFKEKGEVKGEILSLNRIASNHYLNGDFHKAELNLKHLLGRVEDNPRLYTDILGQLIFITSHIGKMADADAYFQLGLEILEQFNHGDQHAWIYLNYGFRFFVAGDFHRAMIYADKGHRINQKIALHRLVPFSHVLLSLIWFHLGEFTKALRIAEKGLEIGRTQGFRETSFVWLLINASFCSARVGHYADAIAFGNEALDVCQDVRSDWSEAWSYNALRHAYRRAGRFAEAESLAKKAIHTVAPLNLSYDEAVFNSELAEILIFTDRYKEAEDILNRAETMLCGSDFSLFRVFLLQSRCALALRRKKQAARLLSKALRINRNGQYDHWIIEEVSWVTHILPELLNVSRVIPNLDDLIEKMGFEATSTLSQVARNKKGPARTNATIILSKLKARPALPLKIHCLGPFEVFRGSELIPSHYWVSKKASMLFKHLIVRYDKGFHSSDMLMEMLWPDADPAKTRNRLHVALTALRQTLEPGLPKGETSAYIKQKAGAYRIELSETGYIDLKAFNSAYDKAKNQSDNKKCIGNLLEAHGIYRGHLFEEDLYDPWLQEQRGFYKAKFIEILDRLVTYYKNRDRLRCIQFVKQYLRCDEYSEEAYQTLIELHWQAGQTKSAMDAFARCRHAIEKELDIPLSPKTLELYRLIKG